MRRCEILALSKGNIDFKNNIIQVRQNVIFKDGNKSEVKDYLKTKAGKRDIPLLPKLTEVLNHTMILCQGWDCFPLTMFIHLQKVSLLDSGKR